MARVFENLVAQNQVGTVTLLFEYCLEESFKTDSPKMHRVTQAEVKRRFDICADIFVKLRGDLKWGLERIGERMPQYVRDQLDGVPWTPGSETFWVPKAQGETP